MERKKKEIEKRVVKHGEYAQYAIGTLYIARNNLI